MHRIRRTAVVFAALAAGGAAAAAPVVAAPVQAVFPFTGRPQTWTAPVGVTQATFMLQGASGGIGSPGGPAAAGGFGATVRATLAVTPGQTYTLFVGGAGGSGEPGGWNGGGAAGGNASAPESGSGGGATDLRTGGSGAPPSARLLVAAGGGGGGGSGPNMQVNGAGGAGGSAQQNGAGGETIGTSGGGGGGLTLGAGGTLGRGPTTGAAGGAAIGAAGGAGAAQPAARAGGNGGGGGGGWTSGGGGGSGSSNDTLMGSGGGGGAGGQNHVDATAQQVTTGLAGELSDGVAAISYEPLETPAIRAQPTLSGVAAVGRQLTCEPGSWSGAPALEYAWLRNGTAIAGARTAQYTPASADGGQLVACEVTATNTVGSAASRTPAALVAAIVAPVLGNAVPPGVTGTAAVGGRLTCAPGVWSGSPAFTYTWLRNGIAIAGAGQATYAATKADAGQVLQCAVRATANGVAAVAQSAGVGGPPRLVVLAETVLVSRTGAVTVPVGCFGPTACRIPAVTVSSGSRAIARAAGRTVDAGATAKIRLVLGSAARKKLARAGSALTVRVVATPTGGVGGNSRAQFVALRGAGLTARAAFARR